MSAAYSVQAAGAMPSSATTTRPLQSVEETVPPFDDSGPVGWWLDLSEGKGTDSSVLGSVTDPLEVRWTFALVGAPEGTEFIVWARFAGAGEIDAVGNRQVTLATNGHDVLADVTGHCILPSVEFVEGVSLVLIGVESVPRPAPLPEVAVAPSEAPPVDRAATSATTGGPRHLSGVSAAPPIDAEEVEPFLPYTGSNEALPLFTLGAALLGGILRKLAGGFV